MNEGTCRQEILAALRDMGIECMAVENPCEPGTPDINWCDMGREGWVELKYLERFPVRKGVVKIEHYTLQQRQFGAHRRGLGGNWALIVVIGEGLERACLGFRGSAGLLVGQKKEAWLWENASFSGLLSWESIAGNIVAK